VTEFNIEDLADEGMKLLAMDINRLYATLGGQLLARKEPTHVAGIISYLSALRSAFSAKALYESLPSEQTELGSGLGFLYEDLKRDGIRYLAEVSENLRRVMCNDEILRLSDQATRSTMQVIIVVVRAALGVHQELQAISVTVAVILFKLGLRNFCR
jgi:hypothetical protein